MPTFTQALLLGGERLTAAPIVPHSLLSEGWGHLDWTGEKEASLLSASALTGTALIAGAMPVSAQPTADPAPAERHGVAPPRAVAVLRQLLTTEWRMLLPEWIERCAAAGNIVPPFFLPTLFNAAVNDAGLRTVAGVAGERGRWLASLNAQWSWVTTTTLQPDPALWETGTPEERLAVIQDLRAKEPERAIALVDGTWREDTAEFRTQVLALFVTGLSERDDPLLTRALGDRRKDVRLTAQALLARLPTSGFAERMKTRATTILSIHRGLLGKRVEVALPGSFDAEWRADGIEEKPPTGIGEKAYWAQQILGFVPLRHWTAVSNLEAPALVSLGSKSPDWGDLLLGAWYRAALIHREPELATALLRPLVSQPKALPPSTSPQEATTALLTVCGEADRWRIVTEDPTIVWSALPLLTGKPSTDQARSVLEHICPTLREGMNPGGSPVAVLAARRIPPELRDEAARSLTRDNGLSKPAETFLRAMELRAELHTAFST